MKFKLIDVGRQHINKEVEVKDFSGLLLEVSKYLMSSEIEVKMKNDKEGTVVVGGFRPVGKVERIE